MPLQKAHLPRNPHFVSIKFCVLNIDILFDHGFLIHGIDLNFFRKRLRSFYTIVPGTSPMIY